MLSKNRSTYPQSTYYILSRHMMHLLVEHSEQLWTLFLINQACSRIACTFHIVPLLYAALRIIGVLSQLWGMAWSAHSVGHRVCNWWWWEDWSLNIFNDCSRVSKLHDIKDVACLSNCCTQSDTMCLTQRRIMRHMHDQSAVRQENRWHIHHWQLRQKHLPLALVNSNSQRGFEDKVSNQILPLTCTEHCKHNVSKNETLISMCC